MEKKEIIANCIKLLEAYREGKLGYMKMPEDSSPAFPQESKEIQLTYFTLPMSLNYKRDGYKLWEAALKTFNDSETKDVFDIKFSANVNKEKLKEMLMKHKVALQPNKHIHTWQTISKTIYGNWGSIGNLLKSAGNDFLKVKETVQDKYKKGFPYLSGPKVFNYWSFILQEYGKVKLKNSEFIEIARDTHITKCSVILGVIDEKETSLPKGKISEKWREVLQGSGINPIEMHPPLWFWSRNGFQYKL